MISITWRRKVLKEQVLVDLPLKGRERAIVNQTNIGTVSVAPRGNVWVERIWAFPSA